MNIRTIKISEIKAAPYNPRKALKPGHEEYRHLELSMQEFGLVEPLIFNERTGNLVGGHQRLTVLINQGAEEVAVSVVDLPLEKEKLLNIAMNKIQGDWDDDKLRDLIEELEKDTEINLEISGFDERSVAKILNENSVNDLAFDLSVESALDFEKSITQPGDVIELGHHRLMCGDSSKLSDLEILMNGQKAKLLHTDPPYNCNYDPAQRPGSGEDRKSERLINDHVDQVKYEEWLAQVFQNAWQFLADGSPFYIWNGHRQFGPMHTMLTRMGAHVSNVITWVKPNPSPSYADYQMQSEFCLYGWFKSEKAHFWYGLFEETNVWELPRDSQSQLVHSTQKPQMLVKRVLGNSSKRGDLVLDLFGGSGSTLIACEKLGRTCYTLEIDPKYCDAIVKRYMKLYGACAVAENVRLKYQKA